MTKAQIIEKLLALGVEIPSTCKTVPALTALLEASSVPTVHRLDLALGMLGFNAECNNVQNMLTMKKGDNYMAYAQLFPVVNYKTIRSALSEDLAKAPTTTVKKGDKTVTVYPWGEMSYKAKAHSLAVSIVKTWERRNLKFNKEGKAVDVVLFAKHDKKSDTDITKTQTVTSKSVHKTYDLDKALAFLASFSKM